MSDPRSILAERAERFTAVVDALPAAAWSAPSPCAGWTAADVLAHVVDTQRDFLTGHGVVLKARPAGEPPAAWAAHRAAVDAVDQAVLDREYDGFFGPTTVGATLVDVYGFDLLVHRWDIAATDGRHAPFTDAELDDLERAIAGFGDALYAEGICGPPVAVPPGADRTVRVLGLLGRDAAAVTPPSASRA
jgi:uncharacterized protein (TIGR03086 family)